MRLALFSCLLITTSLHAAAPDPEHDWPSWRGPNLNGIAASGQTPPTQFSETQNVLWKTAVPGRGHSSPVIIGENILLATADEQRQIVGVICFDRESGKQKWITPVHTGNFPAEIHKKNTHASGTVASDGERIYANFYVNGKIMVSALSMAGKVLWSKAAGNFNPKKYKFGYGASPALYDGNVIVAGEYDGDSFIAAFDGKTGRPIWRIKRRSDISFSSPIVGNVGGRDQLLISGLFEVSSFDPNTGNKLWSVPGTTQATCGTMVWDSGIVFASGGFPESQTIAVKADGSEVLWTNGAKCYEQSMLAHDGYLYGFDDNGIAYCWKAIDGTEMWKRRLGGPVSSSLILAGDVIYAGNERGDVHIFKASPEGFQQVHRTTLGDELFATPAIVDGKAYYRVAKQEGGNRQEYLYCFSK